MTEETIEKLISVASQNLGLEKSLKENLGNYDYAKVLKHISKYEEAIDLFQYILRNEDNKESEHLVCKQIGDCYLEIGNYDQAICWYEKARSANLKEKMITL